GDDRYAAALTYQGSIAIESLSQGALSRFAHRRVRVGEIPWPTVASGNFHRDALGQIFLQMRFCQFQNLVPTLFRDQSKREFRKRVAGDHRFCPLPLVTAADSIDLRSRSRPDALH